MSLQSVPVPGIAFPLPFPSFAFPSHRVGEHAPKDKDGPPVDPRAEALGLSAHASQAILSRKFLRGPLATPVILIRLNRGQVRTSATSPNS